jgi:chromosome segregation ATPase
MNTFLEELESRPGGHGKTESELISLREALESLSANQCSLKQELEKSSDSLAGLGEKLQESRAIEQTLKARIDEDAREIAQLLDKLIAAETDWKCFSEKQSAAAQKRLESLERELESLKFNKAALEESLRARINSDTAKIAELRKKLMAAEIAVADTVKTHYSEEQNAIAEKALDHLKAEVNTLQSEKSALGERTEKTEKLLEQVRKEAAMFAGEAHELNNQIQAGEAALTAANEKLRLSEQREKTARGELTAMHEEVLALRTRLNQSAHALDAERAKVRALAADLNAAQRESEMSKSGGGMALKFPARLNE